MQTQTLWGSIGWATPATLGACIAKPKSRVVLVTGEGSHQLTALEFGNMLRCGVNPVILVLNNKGYTIERILCNTPDDKFNDIVQMNYSKFARIFEGDVWSTKVATEDDLDKALKVTQIMSKLCYIEVCTAPMDMPKLTKDVITSFKKQEKNTEPQKMIVTPQPISTVEKKVDDINNNVTSVEILHQNIPNQELQPKNFVFETTVHKSLMEDE